VRVYQFRHQGNGASLGGGHLAVNQTVVLVFVKFEFQRRVIDTDWKFPAFETTADYKSVLPIYH
jgi:hypothetical protein